MSSRLRSSASIRRCAARSTQCRFADTGRMPRQHRPWTLSSAKAPYLGVNAGAGLRTCTTGCVLDGFPANAVHKHRCEAGQEIHRTIAASICAACRGRAPRRLACGKTPPVLLFPTSRSAIISRPLTCSFMNHLPERFLPSMRGGPSQVKTAFSMPPRGLRANPLN
jgi:hypothetical protein